MEKRQKKELKPNHVLINGREVHKAVAINAVSEWVRRKFSFRGNEAFLHSDPDIHEIGDGIEDELFDLEKFKKTFGDDNKALDYMLFVAFTIGVKSGREMAENDRADEESDETAVREALRSVESKLMYLAETNGYSPERVKAILDSAL